MVADLDGAGNLLRTYVWGQGIDNLLCFTDHTTSNTYYAIKDHLYSVIALVDESGVVVETYEYDAYGNTKVFDASGTERTESAFGNRYLFQGREIDWTTGIYYFRARWYDSASGRWLSKDPIGIEGDLNLYAFCENNPMFFVDPQGLDNLNFASPGSYDSKVIDARGTTDGIFSVGGHGAAGGGVVDQRTGQNDFPTPTELANEISAHSDYSSGMTVILNACQAGKGTYAQELASELGAIVIAPLGNLYTIVLPPSFMGDPKKVLSDLARWGTFKPE